MTVISRVKQTYATLKGADATIKNYALHHPDPHVKEVFNESHRKMKSIVMELEGRIGEIEKEEPQFKGF
ncbi:DUF1657 domain-containing protein [Alkaliphilus transvaalensis]|uniref:DUF1657 domain-containing protein n=1 Tax=Alkaliphilus transvaalensis TaxID=114628 RepID=UPI00047E61DE|nr:DUF1657 domain-containing protein [Alkaliphilus transvaalensis]